MAKRKQAPVKVKSKFAPGTFDAKKRQAFLDAYAAGDTIRAACRKAGTNSTTISNTTRSDPDFKKAYEAATDQNTDKLEQIVDEMARTNRNMVACFFLLKARRPHIYRDNLQVTHNASTELTTAFTAAMSRVQNSAGAT